MSLKKSNVHEDPDFDDYVEDHNEEEEEEEEEFDGEDEDEFDGEDEDMEIDDGPDLESFLLNENGDNVCQVLTTMCHYMKNINKHLNNQNTILTLLAKNLANR